eukprot:5547947-Pleurochrysis_carterae.AAC.1
MTTSFPRTFFSWLLLHPLHPLLAAAAAPTAGAQRPAQLALLSFAPSIPSSFGYGTFSSPLLDYPPCGP